MNKTKPSIAKRIEIKVFHVCYLLVRMFFRIRFVARGIPKHQVLIFFVLKKYVNFCNENSIQYFVFDGTLLGAIRDGKFAGRPSDLDFIVYYEDFKKIESLIKLHPTGLLRIVRVVPILKKLVVVHFGKLQSKTNRSYIPISFLSKEITSIEQAFAKKVVSGGQLCLQVGSTTPDFDFHFFPIEDFADFEKAFIFGLEVNVPKNPRKYLELKYGTDWMTPRITRIETFKTNPELWSTK
jgi:phosphorylcholine metabolism protein LicD